MFRRYIGIDYSGADWPTRSNRDLAVCTVDADGCAVFPDSRRPRVKNWDRGNIATWLVEQFSESDELTLVGIDHGFSFPIEYFTKYGLPCEQWGTFLADFKEHWGTDEKRVVDRRGINERRSRADETMPEEERIIDHRWGNPGWMRLTEEHSPSRPASVFDFDVIPFQKQVATQTHAGLPWLLHIREQLQLQRRGSPVHFWPFDCWTVPSGHSAVVEVYPALWNDLFPNETARLRDKHQRDAYSVARRMWELDLEGRLREYFDPGVPEEQKVQARTEGWIFGVRW